MINKIVLCSPIGTANYIHFRRYADVIAAAGRRQAMNVESLAFSDPRFIEKLTSYAKDPANVIYFTFYAFSEELAPSARLPREVIDIVIKAKAYILARIDDHPFTTFQQSGVIFANPKMGFMVGDVTLEQEAKTVNPALKNAAFQNFGHLPLIDFDEGTHIPFEKREIDVLVPLTMEDHRQHRNIRSLRDSLGPGPLSRVADSTYQTLCADISRSPLEVFINYFEEFAGITVDEVRSKDQESFPSLLSVLSVVDNLVRQSRRFDMLNSLLKSVGNLNVTVLYQHVPGIKVDRRVKFVGRRNGDEYAKMLANSRLVVNCNATFPNSIHGRISNGMSYGCAVISDTNPAITAFFSDKEFIRYSGPGLTLADAFTSHDVAAIAGAGKTRIENNRDFSRDAHVEHIKDLAIRLRDQKPWWKFF